MANTLIIRESQDIPENWLIPGMPSAVWPGTGILANSPQEIRNSHIVTMYQLACEAGIEEKGYNTVRYGGILSYRGEAEIEYHGLRFKATGYGPKGSPEFVSSRGYIKFVQIS